jgi:hypothetical protein
VSVRRAQDERIEGTPDGISAINEIMDVPDTPTIGTATDSGTGTTASVTFTAATTGGTPASYTVTSTPGSITGTGSSSPITVSGLTTNTSYTFKVKAANAAGTYGAESSASNSVTPAVPAPGSYDSLAIVTLSSATSPITFAGIPSGYKHLQIRYSGHLVGTANDYASLWMQFNSDTGSNYSYHRIFGTGSAVTSDAATSQTRALTTWLPDNLTQSLSYGASVIDILDYSNTNKYKTIKDLGGFDLNGSGIVALFSGLWMSTSAISSISLVSSQGQNFAQYSSFALYGVK